MENNNGRGVFYGVIGVATLVVAIIGATFAYFSASAANNNAINVGSTELFLSLDGEKENFYTDLIPVDSDDANFKLYPGLQKKDATHTGKGTCTDDRGNSICGVYEFTVTNPSETVAQTVYGSLIVTKNGFTNLSYAVFKGAASTLASNYDLTGKVGSVTAADTKLIVAKKTFGAEKSTDNWTNATQLLGPGASQTYTVLVWLEEAAAANNTEQGKLFSASVKFDTGSESGVTGTLSAATQTPADPE